MREVKIREVKYIHGRVKGASGLLIKGQNFVTLIKNPFNFIFITILKLQRTNYNIILRTKDIKITHHGIFERDTLQLVRKLT